MNLCGGNFMVMIIAAKEQNFININSHSEMLTRVVFTPALFFV